MCLQHGCHPAALTVSSLKDNLPNVFFLADDPSIQLARQQKGVWPAWRHASFAKRHTIFVVYDTPHLTESFVFMVYFGKFVNPSARSLILCQRELTQNLLYCLLLIVYLLLVNLLNFSTESLCFEPDWLKNACLIWCTNCLLTVRRCCFQANGFPSPALAEIINIYVSFMLSF